MAKRTIRVLRTDTPGNSLAIWLAYHHPDLFLATAQAAKVAKGTKAVQMGWLRGLGQDSTDSFLPGITAYSGDATPPTDFLSTGPSLSIAEPELQTFSIDDSVTALPDNLISDSIEGGTSAVVGAIADTPTSTGGTVGSSLGDSGGIASGVLNALGSVGSYLTSTAGLTNITKLAANVATSYFQGQAAQQAAQTQQQVLATQIARAAASQPAAPIRYTTNAAGQLVPVYATSTPQGTVFQQLTPQGLASLTPSSLTVFLSRYGLWILLAGAAVVLLRR